MLGPKIDHRITYDNRNKLVMCLKEMALMKKEDLHQHMLQQKISSSKEDAMQEPKEIEEPPATQAWAKLRNNAADGAQADPLVVDSESEAELALPLPNPPQKPAEQHPKAPALPKLPVEPKLQAPAAPLPADLGIKQELDDMRLKYEALLQQMQSMQQQQQQQQQAPPPLLPAKAEGSQPANTSQPPADAPLPPKALPPADAPLPPKALPPADAPLLPPPPAKAKSSSPAVTPPAPPTAKKAAPAARAPAAPKAEMSGDAGKVEEALLEHYNMDCEELSQHALYMRAKRLCQRTDRGKLQVPEDVHQQWVEGSRDEILWALVLGCSRGLLTKCKL